MIAVRSRQVDRGGRVSTGDGGHALAVLGVDAAYLRAALDAMEQRFGTIEGYFAQGLGIDEAGQLALREALTESG